MNDYNNGYGVEIPEHTVGIDVSDKNCHYLMLGMDGSEEEEGKVPLKRERMGHLFEAFSKGTRVILEAGTHSAWLSRLAAQNGHEVFVANPRKLRAIYENDNKDDRVDARYLAMIGRLDVRLLSPIQHRGVQAQVDLAVLKSRDALVRARSRLIGHVRSSVKSFGERIRACDADAFHRHAAKDIPEQLQSALLPLTDTIGRLTEQIREYDRRVEEISGKYPETEILRQPDGVGPITALAYLLKIEDPGRFHRSRSLGPYLGMKPKRHKSGERDPQLRISKAGDAFLRRLLVQSAQYILGPFGKDCDLRTWGLKLIERGGKGAKKRAVVAVARKLAVLLHRLWVTEKPYEPLRQAKLQEEARPLVFPAEANYKEGSPDPSRARQVDLTKQQTP
jgi:transposase